MIIRLLAKGSNIRNFIYLVSDCSIEFNLHITEISAQDVAKIIPEVLYL